MIDCAAIGLVKGCIDGTNVVNSWDPCSYEKVNASNQSHKSISSSQLMTLNLPCVPHTAEIENLGQKPETARHCFIVQQS
jgi:hypothetical protein